VYQSHLWSPYGRPIDREVVRYQVQLLLTAYAKNLVHYNRVP